MTTEEHGDDHQVPESDLRLEVRALVERSRRAQGLPPKIEDPAVIARIAALLEPPEGDAGWCGQDSTGESEFK